MHAGSTGNRASDWAGRRAAVDSVLSSPTLQAIAQLLSEARRRDLAYAASKRALDLVVALMLLIAFLPVFAVIGLAIVRESGFPILYRAERVGRFGRPFTMAKFRSMQTGCDQTPHMALVRSLMQGASSCDVYKVADDRRITRVGAFLRRTSLDELPQLWNVLRGEMSLVGPRPDVPYSLAGYDDAMHRRLVMKPGVTGLWQVSGRSRLSLREMYRLDAAYVAGASLQLDLRILLRTIPVVLSREGAA
jgi:lipopolysaccharide/colanic/teichoic acid biosynthesis glycosyltransferase